MTFQVVLQHGRKTTETKYFYICNIISIDVKFLKFFAEEFTNHFFQQQQQQQLKEKYWLTQVSDSWREK